MSRKLEGDRMKPEPGDVVEQVRPAFPASAGAVDKNDGEKIGFRARFGKREAASASLDFSLTLPAAHHSDRSGSTGAGGTPAVR